MIPKPFVLSWGCRFAAQAVIGLVLRFVMACTHERTAIECCVEADDSPHTQTHRFRAPKPGNLALMPTLMLSIGLLVLLSAGFIVAVNWVTGRAIVQEFATRLIARGLSLQEMALRRHLDAAVDQATFIADAIRDGRYKFSDPALDDFISGTMAAAPQIGGLILAGPSGKALRVVRGASNSTLQLDHFDLTGDRQLAEIADEIRRRKDTHWGPPVYRERAQTTSLNYRMPIRKGDQYLGFVAVAVSTHALSILCTELSEPPRSLAFMLYGQDRVLAHPAMLGGSRPVSEAAPLHLLRTFGDRVIENFSTAQPLDKAGIAPPPGAMARQQAVDGELYFLFTRDIPGYGDLPITIGAYFLGRAVDAPLRLFYWASIIALVMLGASLVAAAWMARTIAGPIRRAAKGAAAIGTLDFDKVAPLEHSRFREINDLAHSFNAMLDGLRAFGRYVPRTLVTRLVKEGRVGAGTEERTLAIMFTDIVGFTSACEKLRAREVAEYINHHLALVAACVEQEGGTIDKFIGDAVMAFWGAPARVENSGNVGLPRGSRHSDGDSSGKPAPDRRWSRACSHSDRHPYGNGSGRRHRCSQPDQLHDRRRRRERDATSGKPWQVG